MNTWTPDNGRITLIRKECDMGGQLSDDSRYFPVHQNFFNSLFGMMRYRWHSEACHTLSISADVISLGSKPKSNGACGPATSSPTTLPFPVPLVPVLTPLTLAESDCWMLSKSNSESSEGEGGRAVGPVSSSTADVSSEQGRSSHASVSLNGYRQALQF